ncbi:MAG: DUF3332 domain-containing protein [Fibrobacterota bacterium]
MKKSIIRMTVIALVAAFLFSGCYGQFYLTKKIYKWNGSLGDKFLNSIVCWLLITVQVYTVAGAADFFFFNVLEFWTGSNPLAMKEGDIQQQTVTQDGVVYNIKATQDRFDISRVGSDAAVSLVYNAGQHTWSVQTDEKSFQIATVKDAHVVEVINPDKTTFLVDTRTGEILN